MSGNQFQGLLDGRTRRMRATRLASAPPACVRLLALPLVSGFQLVWRDTYTEGEKDKRRLGRESGKS
jgi:hypothetical protein